MEDEIDNLFGTELGGAEGGAPSSTPPDVQSGTTVALGAASGASEEEDDVVGGAPAAKRARLVPTGGGGASTASSSTDSDTDTDSDSDSSDSDSSSSTGSTTSTSSSASTPPAPRRGQLGGGKLRRLGKGGDTGAGMKARPKREKRPAVADGTAKGEGKGGAGTDSEGSYDSASERDEVNSEDEGFIDKEDDAEDLRREYDREKQDFHDVRAVGGKKKKRRGAEAEEEGEGGRRKSQAGEKRKRAAGLTEQERDDVVIALVRDMAAAADGDKRDKACGRPTIAKLRLASRVRAAVANASLHTKLMQGVESGPTKSVSVLRILREWLRPLPPDPLPSLPVRELVYEALERLPMENPEHVPDLKQSEIGSVLMALARSSGEEKRNRERLARVIDRMTRAIYRKAPEYRGRMDEIMAHQAEAGVLPTRPLAAPLAPAASTTTTGSGAGGDADFGSLLGRELAMGGAGGGQGAEAERPSRHARIPTKVVFDFVTRADSSVGLSPAEAIAAAAAAAGGKHGSIRKRAPSEMEKRMTAAKRKEAKGVERGAVMSVEGRGL